MKEESFGVIPLRKEGEEWQTFLVQLHAGHWTFPKGRKNHHETSLNAATRELKEETNLTVIEFLSIRPYLETYRFEREGVLIDKFAWYYPAMVKGDVELQAAEIKEGRWVSFHTALDLLTYLPTKNVAHQVFKDLGI